MHTILTLALGKLRYHKSRTLLTGMAIFLTTTLLMATATSGIAIFNMNKLLAMSSGDEHAAIHNLSREQISILNNHKDIQALSTLETFASLAYEKMNGILFYQETQIDGFYNSFDTSLMEGHLPQKTDEICGAPAFFERMGIEPVLGKKISISFRPGERGKIITRDFTICGIEKGYHLAQIEETEISDNRILYPARISKALIEQYEKSELYEPSISADIKVYGEEDLTYPQMIEKIESVAADIGIKPSDMENNITYNKQYLRTMTDPDTETVSIVSFICLIIIFFFVLVIYSIYYVGIITDIQEIGKLKAMGASKKQIRRTLLAQGGITSLFAIPPGLILGYLLVYFLFPVIMDITITNTSILGGDGGSGSIKVPMFSLPVLLIVAAAVLFGVYLSLLKPMRMAGKISPVEAIRYQESSTKKKMRKGRRQVNVAALTYANLARNKKRTVITMASMGLSCVFFLAVAGIMSSIRTEDMARETISYGSFRISLNYAGNDTAYPENNLDNLVQQDYFNKEFLDKLNTMEGVKKADRGRGIILASTNDPSKTTLFENEGYGRLPVSYFTREDVPAIKKELKWGDLDYDKMTQNNEILFGNDYLFDSYRLKLGDHFDLTLYDGNRQIPFSAALSACAAYTVEDAMLLVTEDTFNSLGLTCDPTTRIYIYEEKGQYDKVKSSLQDIADENPYFLLYSIDEEMKIAASQIGMIKYPIYMILIFIAVIGFMNLINTMITSVITRKKEIGILQAVGLSPKQLAFMLSLEGTVFIMGTLVLSTTLGNLGGYMLFLYAREAWFMGVTHYRYPLWETIGLACFLSLGQLFITLFINRKVIRGSLIARIRSEE